MIVAAEVTTSPRDVGQLVPMVEAVKANTGRRPGIAVADNGYLSEANLEQLASPATALLDRRGTRRQEAARWPKGRAHAADAPDPAPAVGPADLRPPQDPRRAALRGDQADDALPALLASGTSEHPR